MIVVLVDLEFLYLYKLSKGSYARSSIDIGVCNHDKESVAGVGKGLRNQANKRGMCMYISLYGW